MGAQDRGRGAEAARDGWYLLHTNLPVSGASPAQVRGHYKNLLEVEEAFCELKGCLRVRPVFHHRPDRVVNHVRVCFLAYSFLLPRIPLSVDS